MDVVMAKAKRQQALQLDQAKATAGVLALLADERERRTDENHEPRRTESVLAGAGLTAPEIAALLGKNKDAVAKAITRGRTAKKKTSKRK
jgi:DNA-directed RNA polymerase specialized sigma24 family protein